MLLTQPESQHTQTRPARILLVRHQLSISLSVTMATSRLPRSQSPPTPSPPPLSSGPPQAVSFSTSGVPTRATASFTTSTSCTPTCSSTVNIAPTASTLTGTYAIIVIGIGGGITK